MSAAANRNDEGLVVPVFDRLAVEPRPLAQMIWDTCVVVGPQTHTQLFERLEHLMGDASREHALRNPNEKRGPITGRMLFDDKHEHLALGIKQGLERGWLKLFGNAIDAADPPPQHSPLGYLAVSGTIEQRAKAVVDAFSDDQSRARRLLQDAMLSRKKPTPEGRAALRDSLEQIGQITPILRWRQVAAPPIIVDGVTRLELCEELGLEPHFLDLPPSTTPLEALSYRIALDVAGTSKGQHNRTRDQYTESLAKAGFTQESIAASIKDSRALVNKVLKDRRIKTSGRPSPTEQDVDEFVALARRGESLRAIAAETGWGQQTVLTHLTMRRDAVPPLLPNMESELNVAKARPHGAVRDLAVKEKLRASLANHPERTMQQHADAAGGSASTMLVKREVAFMQGEEAILTRLRAAGCTHLSTMSEAGIHTFVQSTK